MNKKHDWAKIAKKINTKHRRVTPYTVGYLYQVWKGWTQSKDLRTEIQAIIAKEKNEHAA